jgi:hypothetical protein
MLLERLRRPRSLRRRAEHMMEDMGEMVRHRPRGTIAGSVLVLLLIAAVVWMYPEFQRYMRIRRM